MTQDIPQAVTPARTLPDMLLADDDDARRHILAHLQTQERAALPAGSNELTRLLVILDRAPTRARDGILRAFAEGGMAKAAEKAREAWRAWQAMARGWVRDAVDLHCAEIEIAALAGLLDPVRHDGEGPGRRSRWRSLVGSVDFAPWLASLPAEGLPRSKAAESLRGFLRNLGHDIPVETIRKEGRMLSALVKAGLVATVAGKFLAPAAPVVNPEGDL